MNAPSLKWSGNKDRSATTLPEADRMFLSSLEWGQGDKDKEKEKEKQYVEK
jgi:hypothetical protein